MERHTQVADTIIRERQKSIDNVIDLRQKNGKLSLNRPHNRIPESVTPGPISRWGEEKGEVIGDAGHRTLFDHLDLGILYLNDAGSIVAANSAAQQLLGGTPEQLLGLVFDDLHWQAVRERELPFPAHERPAAHVMETGNHISRAVMSFLSPRLDVRIYVVLTVIPEIRTGDDKPYRALVILEDASKHDREAEKNREVTESEAKEQDQLCRNTAIGNVLERLKNEQKLLAAQVQSNVDRVINPLLQRLNECVTDDGKEHLELLSRALGDITAPFVNRLESIYNSLTRREVEICDMVRNGKSSKEIAAALGISIYTVHNIRARVRRKLKLLGDERRLNDFLRDT